MDVGSEIVKYEFSSFIQLTVSEGIDVAELSFEIRLRFTGDFLDMSLGTRYSVGYGLESVGSPSTK